MDAHDGLKHLQDLVGQGKYKDAREFLKTHHDDLGDFYAQATDLLDGDATEIIAALEKMKNND
ncbi:hypothetical protein [Levilactobacillus bambusae]|uniref:Uncharacterized protein n=1 Tax=Levilactobacillus bambusae TaxID=2024736 RepID=A0A2V1N0D1_9LACO|nr:hypothetical protein [Levilactobacillus bambusae]PWG00198.1 hypothetical protein DCM90_04495 [Levilactobacillus bambusae]